MRLKKYLLILPICSIVLLATAYQNNLYSKPDIESGVTFTADYVSSAANTGCDCPSCCAARGSDRVLGYFLYKDNKNDTILNVHGKTNSKGTIIINYGDKVYQTIQGGSTFVANIPWNAAIDEVSIENIEEGAQYKLQTLTISNKVISNDANSSSISDPGYVLDLVNENNKGVKWNTCKPIKYTINTTNAPAGAEEFVKKAMEEVETQTGIDFSYIGLTNKNLWPKGKNNFKKSAMYTDQTITFLWDSRTFPNEGANEFGARYLGYAFKGFQKSKKRGSIFSGVIVFNTDFFNTAKAIDKTHKHVLLHELGHVLNLAHTADPSQVMYSSVNTDEPNTFESFQDKDLQGISHVKKKKC